MAKALITLNNAATLIADFKQQFDGNNVPFVVLGNTGQHIDLANKAAAAAQNWDIAILVPQPADLYATLLTLPTDACALANPYDPPNLYAVAIAADTTICYVMTAYDPASIAAAFMLAETH